MTLPLGIVASAIIDILKGGLRDTDFSTNIGTGANDLIWFSSVQSDGKIVVGGSFTSWNGSTVGSIVRLNSDGARDTAFSTNVGTGASGAILNIFIQSDGKIIVAGTFTSWNGTSTGRIVRLNSDGSRDTAFSTNVGTGANDNAHSIGVQSDGKILIGGSFSSWNGTTVGRIVRLNSDGTRDTVFSTNVGTGAGTSEIYSLALQSDGKILCVGSFGTWNGTTVGRMVRLNSNGTRDTAFSTNVGTGANNNIFRVFVQSNDKILIGGAFSSWNGSSPAYFVRLNSDGTRDTAFLTNVGTGPNDETRGFSVQSDGKILIGGNFSSWNGSTAGNIVRLNSDGTTDTAFSTNVGTGGGAGALKVYSIVLQSDGKIVVGGGFTSWNGTTVGRIVRLGGGAA